MTESERRKKTREFLLTTEQWLSTLHELAGVVNRYSSEEQLVFSQLCYTRSLCRSLKLQIDGWEYEKPDANLLLAYSSGHKDGLKEAEKQQKKEKVTQKQVFIKEANQKNKDWYEAGKRTGARQERKTSTREAEKRAFTKGHIEGFETGRHVGFTDAHRNGHNVFADGQRPYHDGFSFSAYAAKRRDDRLRKSFSYNVEVDPTYIIEEKPQDDKQP